MQAYCRRNCTSNLVMGGADVVLLREIAHAWGAAESARPGTTKRTHPKTTLHPALFTSNSTLRTNNHTRVRHEAWTAAAEAQATRRRVQDLD